MPWDNDGPNLKCVCNLTCVHASCSTESKQCKLTRVEAPLNRDCSNGTLHIGVSNLDDALRQPCRGDLKFLCEGGGAFHRAFDVKRHAALKKIVRIEAAQKQVRIGDGELVTLAIADRSRIGAGTPRSDAQCPTTIHVGDGTSPSPDRVDVEHRQTDGKVSHHRFI